LSGTRKITPKKVNIGGHIRGMRAPLPLGLPPILRNAWKFARNMAKEFAKQLLDKDKEEEFLKVVRKEFEKDKRR